MSWSLYTTLTARNRAIEAIVAGFVLFWAARVLRYWGAGTGPLSWAAIPEARQWHHPAALLLASATHMTGRVRLATAVEAAMVFVLWARG